MSERVKVSSEEHRNLGWEFSDACLALISRAFAALVLSACLGCDLGEYATPGPSRVCLESGALCQLESGPLGVCENRPCRPGETSPCFTCTPQH